MSSQARCGYRYFVGKETPLNRSRGPVEIGATVKKLPALGAEGLLAFRSFVRTSEWPRNPGPHTMSYMSALSFRAFTLAFALNLGVFGAARGGSASDENWPQLRGPGGRGISTNSHLPDHWSETENVAWKSDIPGRAWSSPIVWGQRVFLTTAISPGPAESPKKGLYLGGERPDAPRLETEWKVLCLDLATGKLQWEQVVHRAAPDQPIHLKNSYASETPVTDGERIYVLVGNAGVFCLDFQGHAVWSKALPAHKMRYGWGTAASPGSGR